jgi:hypothetical protein
MRTTLRFTSVVAGVAALILLAAIILSGKDWLSTSPGVNQRIAVHTSAPAPRPGAPTPLAIASAPQAAAPAPHPGAWSGPDMAPAATVSTPQPAAAVHAVVGQASGGRAALSMARADEERADHSAGHRRSGHGHDVGGDRRTPGRGGGDEER